jgi:hypothetical protein
MLVGIVCGATPATDGTFECEPSKFGPGARLVGLLTSACCSLSPSFGLRCLRFAPRQVARPRHGDLPSATSPPSPVARAPSCPLGAGSDQLGRAGPGWGGVGWAGLDGPPGADQLGWDGLGWDGPEGPDRSGRQDEPMSPLLVQPRGVRLLSRVGKASWDGECAAAVSGSEGLARFHEGGRQGRWIFGIGKRGEVRERWYVHEWGGAVQEGQSRPRLKHV